MEKYTGELKRLGAGRTDKRYGHSRYAVIEIGNSVITKVNANEIISTYLDIGENMELYIGRLFGQKYVYAVRYSDGRLFKIGKGSFIGSVAIKAGILICGLPMVLLSKGYLLLPWGAVAAYLGYRSVKAIMDYRSIR